MNLYRVTLPLYRRAAIDDVIELTDGEAERLLRIGAVELASPALIAAMTGATTAEGIVDVWSSPIPAELRRPLVQQQPAAETVAPKSAKAVRKPASKPASKSVEAK